MCALAPTAAARSGGSTPPPNPAIAYVDVALKVMNADGTNKRSVFTLQSGESVRAPAWSPDSTQLVFYGRIGGVYGVHTVPVAGGVPFRVATCQDITFPDWSPLPTPDGQHKVVFTDLVQVPNTPLNITRSDVFLANLDGSGRVNLTNTSLDSEVWPAWAPDGRRIAVSRGGSLVILTLGLVNGALAIVSENVACTPAGATVAFPRWANTVDEVTFSVSAGPLRVATFDLTDPLAVPVLLTPSATSDERWSSYSPDDTRLAYHRGGGSGGIFVIGADGAGSLRISSKGYDPRWRRAP